MLRQKVIIQLKSSDPLNLPMTPKFSNKGSSMTPKNSGLAETLKGGGLLNTCATYIDFFRLGSNSLAFQTPQLVQTPFMH